MPITALLQQIRDVRRRSPLLYLEISCNGSRCPVREVTLHMKDHDRELVALLRRRGGFTCPVCGGAMVLHGVRTAAQQDALDDYEARCSVNRQMYVRDHGSDGRLAIYPGSIAMRDDLPPTPPGWFAPTQTPHTGDPDA